MLWLRLTVVNPATWIMSVTASKRCGLLGTYTNSGWGTPKA